MRRSLDNPQTDLQCRRCSGINERVRLLEAVVGNFPGGILLLDEQLNVVFCNDQQKRLLDYPEALFAAGNPSLEQLFRFNAQRGEYGPGNADQQVAERLERARQRVVHTFERTRPNGTVIEVRGVPLPGGGFVTTYADVTEQRRNQRLIEYMAHHDPLTRLPNRALLFDRLQQALARVKRGEIVALHYLDLDRFKPVNDNLGHAAGDNLLVAVAQRLCDSIRETDTVARFGGDEFVIVQSDLDNAGNASLLASRLTAALAAPFVLPQGTVTIGASIGVALAPRDGVDAELLLSRADAALYACKSLGRGRFGFHQPECQVPRTPG